MNSLTYLEYDCDVFVATMVTILKQNSVFEKKHKETSLIGLSWCEGHFQGHYILLGPRTYTRSIHQYVIEWN